MEMSYPEPSQEEVKEEILSPFAQTSSMVKPGRSSANSSLPLWIVSGLLALLLFGIAGYFIMKYVNDPYRTLEVFPVDKYLSDYRSLSGAKFKADLKVMNDLGWKENVGHLMVFVTTQDSHPIVVLIPARLSGIYFTKGQTYLASLEVGEGGVIYADSCEKE